jgi:hypothetical protein
MKPWQQEMWCIPKPGGEYVARMEDVLDLYEQPLDPQRPPICYDEWQRALIGETCTSWPAQPGRRKRKEWGIRDSDSYESAVSEIHAKFPLANNLGHFPFMEEIEAQRQASQELKMLNDDVGLTELQREEKELQATLTKMLEQAKWYGVDLENLETWEATAQRHAIKEKQGVIRQREAYYKGLFD